MPQDHPGLSRRALFQLLHSDKRGQGPVQHSLWMHCGLKPLSVLLSHPDKIFCDECRSESSEEKHCEEGLEDLNKQLWRALEAACQENVTVHEFQCSRAHWPVCGSWEQTALSHTRAKDARAGHCQNQPPCLCSRCQIQLNKELHSFSTRLSHLLLI